MTPENQAFPEKQKRAKSSSKAKKPYQKPAFRHERVFETLALACGKIGSTSAQCQVQRKSS